MIARGLTNLNSIINETARAMSSLMYQNARAMVLTNGINLAYNAVENGQNRRGLSAPITCGVSKCGSDSSPVMEFCKLR